MSWKLEKQQACHAMRQTAKQLAHFTEEERVLLFLHMMPYLQYFDEYKRHFTPVMPQAEWKALKKNGMRISSYTKVWRAQPPEERKRFSEDFGYSALQLVGKMTSLHRKLVGKAEHLDGKAEHLDRRPSKADGKIRRFLVFDKANTHSSNYWVEKIVRQVFGEERPEAREEKLRTLLETHEPVSYRKQEGPYPFVSFTWSSDPRAMEVVDMGIGRATDPVIVELVADVRSDAVASAVCADISALSVGQGLRGEQELLCGGDDVSFDLTNQDGATVEHTSGWSKGSVDVPIVKIPIKFSRR